MSMVRKKMYNLLIRHAWQRQLRDAVLGKEQNCVGLNTCFCTSTDDFTQKDKCVDMKGHWRMPVSLLVLIVDCSKFFDDDVVARLLLHFAHDGRTGA